MQMLCSASVDLIATYGEQYSHTLGALPRTEQTVTRHLPATPPQKFNPTIQCDTLTTANLKRIVPSLVWAMRDTFVTKEKFMSLEKSHIDLLERENQLVIVTTKI